MSGAPTHHQPGGGFRNPWLERQPGSQGARELLRWQWQRLWQGLPKRPAAESLAAATPAIDAPLERDSLRVTWIGQASFLLEVGGRNLLTDPVFSRRASPVQWAGPARLTPPPITVRELPAIDAVLVSHDHYDHLDLPTVRALRDRFGERITWFTPLGYRAWFRRQGIERVVELDWWEEALLAADPTDAARAAPTPVSNAAGAPGGELRVRALPAQHWTRRSPFDRTPRLWCSWAVDDGTNRVYFGGDSGYCPAFTEIGRRAGPFDVSLLPIGAYEPRWFMETAHMNPEEAVQSYLDLGGRGAFVGMHWGTFVLTDEPVLEPPARVRRAWEERGLPADDLWLLGHGETRTRSAGAARLARSHGDES